MRKSEYPKDIKTIGRQFRRARLDKQLSLLDVTKRAGIGEGYLSKIENDKAIPSYTIAIKIANVLNVGFRLRCKYCNGEFIYKNI